MPIQTYSAPGTGTMTLDQMRARLVAIHTESTDILDAAGENVSVEVQTRLDHLHHEFQSLERKIKLGEAAAARGEYLDSPRNGGRRTDPGNPAATFTDALQPQTPVAKPSRGRTFEAMFPDVQLSNRGFPQFEDFLRSVHSGRADTRLVTPMAAMNEGIGSEGGFLVPEEHAAMVLNKSLESEIVRPRAAIYPMTSDTKVIAGFDVHDNSSHLMGGFQAQWLAEKATATRSEGKVRAIQLRAKRLALYTNVSNELVADAGSFESLLGDALIRATGWYMDLAFLTGDGAGKPLGVLHDPALITVNKEAAQAADTIVWENVVKMFARLHPACVSNSVWVANSTTIPQLLTMYIALGLGGQQVRALQETGAGYELLTRPIFFTEKVPALGNVGDIMLCDFSQYAVGLRAEIVLEKSNAPGWTEDLSDYRAKMRVDGMGTWASAFTPKNGDTLSWAVALQAR